MNINIHTIIAFFSKRYMLLLLTVIAIAVIVVQKITLHSANNFFIFKASLGHLLAHKNLYAFWKETLTNALNKELKKDDLFINLASNEYFSVIDTKKLKVPVITPEFKDYKDGKLKIISFFAKKARGLMVRYIIDNDIETIDGLKGFNYEGYAFDGNLSEGNTLVFTR